jgi:hypothetical protein
LYGGVYRLTQKSGLALRDMTAGYRLGSERGSLRYVLPGSNT